MPECVECRHPRFILFRPAVRLVIRTGFWAWLLGPVKVVKEAQVAICAKCATQQEISAGGVMRIVPRKVEQDIQAAVERLEQQRKQAREASAEEDRFGWRR